LHGPAGRTLQPEQGAVPRGQRRRLDAGVNRSKILTPPSREPGTPSRRHILTSIHFRRRVMVRRLLPVAALVAITSAGCVPVTEPVGDVEKAEPDKNLVGTWNGSGEIAIDVPEVKGNPKGLMRAVSDGKVNDPENVLWFFTTKIGKHMYANVVLIGGKLESL